MLNILILMILRYDNASMIAREWLNMLTEDIISIY